MSHDQDEEVNNWYNMHYSLTKQNFKFPFSKLRLHRMLHSSLLRQFHLEKGFFLKFISQFFLQMKSWSLMSWSDESCPRCFPFAVPETCLSCPARSTWEFGFCINLKMKAIYYFKRCKRSPSAIVALQKTTWLKNEKMASVRL